LRLREPEEAIEEIDALALYKNQGLTIQTMPYVVYAIARNWDGKRIFLQDGDALVYPFPKLKRVLEHLNEKFPDLERISAYATAKDILRREVKELKQLKELKLNFLYMGVESGDDEILKRIRKRATCAEMVEAGHKAKEAGIGMSATIILGLGGVENSSKHAHSCARILSEIDPEYAAALTLLIVPGTPIEEEIKRGDFHLITPFESLEELKLIIENANFTNCFFTSMHASNYLPVRVRLPEEKEKIIKVLESILAKKDPSLLKPEYFRAL